MYESITPTGVITAATTWAGEIDTIVLIVLGFSVTLVLGTWIVYKFRARRGGKKRKVSKSRRKK